MRRAYADRGLAQIPRLLSLEDRNEFSRTYGSFNREYWLCRSVDFPSSIAQFGVHALALAYTQPFPDNPYYRNPKILLWALAAIENWIEIQRPDGSFDEFYPNERGWAGPTGFLVYAMCDYLPAARTGTFRRDLDERFRIMRRAGGALPGEVRRAGCAREPPRDGVLPIYEAYALLNDPKLLAGFHVRLDDFLSYCYEEGWCLEYDGADSATSPRPSPSSPSCASSTRMNGSRRSARARSTSAPTSSCPDGHYGGAMGSRQTLHFYPHGFELFAPENPTAAAVAEAMLRSLWRGKLVPPEIQEDRYFLYRIPELLLSYVDWKPRVEPLPALPHEGPPFRKKLARRADACAPHAGSVRRGQPGEGGDAPDLRALGTDARS